MKALIIIGIALTPICLGSAQAADCVSQAMDAVESRSPEQAVGAWGKGARKGDERFFRGVGVPKDRVAAHMWTSLAAAQGNERVRSQLALMEDAMTADEIAQAKAKAATFRPKQRPRPRRWTRQEVLRAVGIHGPVGEYTRLFGH